MFDVFEPMLNVFIVAQDHQANCASELMLTLSVTCSPGLGGGRGCGGAGVRRAVQLFHRGRAGGGEEERAPLPAGGGRQHLPALAQVRTITSGGGSSAAPRQLRHAQRVRADDHPVRHLELRPRHGGPAAAEDHVREAAAGGSPHRLAQRHPLGQPHEYPFTARVLFIN